MTTSLKALARCLDLSGNVSVKDDLIPPALAPSGLPFNFRPGLDPSDRRSLLWVMRFLEWKYCGDANYLKMPVPPEYRSPSREEAQILIDGIVQRIELFMGRSDWELDWHIYPQLTEPVEARLRRVGRLRETLFSELMVVNRWEDERLGRQWWSNDLDGVLSLRWPLEDAHPAAETASDHWSLAADDNQGHNTPVADVDDPQTRRNSAIVGGRVYLQGAFVRDTPTDDDGHNHLEIHPLDSVAYARDAAGKVLTARPTDSAWPDTTVNWRVAVLTNAGFHRINSCDFLKKERTTVWYLDLPSAAPRSEVTVTVTEIEPGYWHSPTNRRFPRRRVKRITVRPTPDGRARRYTDFPVDPADGRHKLRIEVTMERPDDWGGLFLRDYVIRAGPTTSADS